MERRLHTCAEEAARLGTTRRHIEGLVRRWGMPHVKLGGKVRFDPDEVDAWLETRRVERSAS